MTSPFQPVDYLSRDYAALRSDMISGIPLRLPEWKSRSSNDFGIALIELFAYMGDGLHYYADRVANEAFLATATQRSSVLAFARLLDYRPQGNTAASVSLTFSNATASPAVVPAGTRIATENLDVDTRTVYFETQEAVTVPANGNAATTALEGTTVALEDLGSSSGLLNQDFTLTQVPVIEGSVRLSVAEATTSEWTFFEHLLDAGPDTLAYGLYTDERGVVHVVFGDGVNGKVPTLGAPVRATYRVGGGTLGNVGAGQLTRIITSVPLGVTVTNQAAAVGGANAETLNQIKRNAPRSLYTLNRAVTLTDYARLAVQLPFISHAQAVSAAPNSVVLYAVPVGGGALDPDEVTDLAAYLESRKQATTTVTVFGADYVGTDITVSIQVRPRFDRERVRTAVLKALGELLDINNVILGDRISMADVFSAALSVEGVDYLTVDALSRQGVDPDPASADALFRDNELPIVGVVTVNATGGIA